MSATDSIARFQQRADDYAASRPDYPAALLDCVLGRLALSPGAGVADIGSGTGIFTRLLLARGLRVAAVEPGDDMRRTAEALLGAHDGFVSVGGSARATGLATGSVAAIFCAQAFHWFNEAPTLREWRRILRPGGSAVLIWNYHDETDAFVADYVNVIRSFGPEAERTMAAAWNAHRDNVLFREGAADTAWFAHGQSLDFPGLLRRAGSTSYLPKPGDASFPELSDALRAVFDRHRRDGRVTMVYRTVAVFGPLD